MRKMVLGKKAKIDVDKFVQNAGSSIDILNSALESSNYREK